MSESERRSRLLLLGAIGVIVFAIGVLVACFRLPEWRNRDVPPKHVEEIQTDYHPTGVGQMATPLITPAVSNAIMALTGKRLRHAPFTEERVKKAIG